MRVLGVDPGTQVTGYGVIETGNGNGVPGLGRLIECGVFRFRRTNSLPHRLAELHQAIALLIKRHQPSVLALEDAFYHKNVRTTLVLPMTMMSQARLRRRRIHAQSVLSHSLSCFSAISFWMP